MLYLVKEIEKEKTTPFIGTDCMIFSCTAYMERLIGGQLLEVERDLLLFSLLK